MRSRDRHRRRAGSRGERGRGLGPGRLYRRVQGTGRGREGRRVGGHVHWCLLLHRAGSRGGGCIHTLPRNGVPPRVGGGPGRPEAVRPSAPPSRARRGRRTTPVLGVGASRTGRTGRPAAGTGGTGRAPHRRRRPPPLWRERGRVRRRPGARWRSRRAHHVRVGDLGNRTEGGGSRGRPPDGRCRAAPRTAALLAGGGSG